MGYEAFVLTKEARQHLCGVFPPKYAEWIGHHVTHRFGTPRQQPIGPVFFDPSPYGHFVMPQNEICSYGDMGVFVIGYTEDDGIEALVCTVDGGSQRPDGGTYHITWSLDRSKGWKPVDSNRIIAQRGNTPCDPIAVPTTFEYID